MLTEILSELQKHCVFWQSISSRSGSRATQNVLDYQSRTKALSSWSSPENTATLVAYCPTGPQPISAQTTIKIRLAPAYRQDCWNSPSSPSPSKVKRPPRPCSAREGVGVFGAPTIVPRVGYELCLPRFHPPNSCGGLTYHSRRCRCQELSVIPLSSEGDLQAPGKITTTNPWLRLPIPRGGT